MQSEKEKELWSHTEIQIRSRVFGPTSPRRPSNTQLQNFQFFTHLLHILSLLCTLGIIYSGQLKKNKPHVFSMPVFSWDTVLIVPHCGHWTISLELLWYNAEKQHCAL